MNRSRPFRISAFGVLSGFGFRVSKFLLPFLLLSALSARAQLDFGDAPTNYLTLLIHNGARHTISTDGPRLGLPPDSEPDGQPTAGADGDNSTETDDEDGVNISALIIGRTSVITFSLGSTGRIDAWIDFNGDGDWSDPGEQVATNHFELFTPPFQLEPVPLLSVNVPTNAVAGLTYARFRVSSIGHLPCDGPADDGEVEDYAVPLVNVAEIVLTMTGAPEPVTVNGLLTYTIAATNIGLATATNLVLVDGLPLNLSFVSASPGCINAGGIVTCVLGDVPPGGSATVSITGLVVACVSPFFNFVDRGVMVVGPGDPIDPGLLIAPAFWTSTIMDTNPPMVLAPAMDLVLQAPDTNCLAEMPDFISFAPSGGQVPLAMDDCTDVALLTLLQSIPPGPLSVGVHTNVFTVTDPAGNMAFSTNLVTVADVTPPVITFCFPDTVAFLDANCQAFIPDLTTTNTIIAMDLCSSVTITQALPIGTPLVLAPGMTFTGVVVTAFDASGNFTQCVAEVFPYDITPPVITWCFTNLTLAADPVTCSALMPDATGTNYILATDNCGSLVITQSVATNTPLALGTNVVVLTAIDAFMNEISCTNTIVVVDQSPPTVLSCPSPVLDAGTNCMATVPDLTFQVEAMDCSQPFTVTQSPTNGTELAVGTYPITFTITDTAGNTTHWTNIITIRDVTPPVILGCAPALKITADDSETAPAPNLSTMVTAMDNCPGTLTYTQSVAAGTTLPYGVHPITLTVADASGNTAECTTTFTVANAVPLSGLWVGKVRVTRVSDGTVNGSPSAPVASPFEFRLIFHAISNATMQEVRLLKDVIAVQQRVGTNPPTVALVTDPAVVVSLTNAVRGSDGRLLATRYATAAYDYDGFMPLMMTSSGPAGTNANMATLNLATNATSNPFRHKFHPDHRAGLEIGRTLGLRFTRTRNDPVREPPGYGVQRMAGLFREELTGLRAGQTLVVEGTFSVNRVHDTETLITGP